MKVWLYLTAYGLTVTLNATTFNVTTNASAGAGSFVEAVDNANLTSGNDILFDAVSPTTIGLTSAMVFSQTYTINGTNSNNGIIITTANASAITIASGVTTTMTNSAGTMEFNVVIGGAANSIITKTGAGILSLSGTNTYSGGTNLTEGQITLGDNAGLGTGTLTMANTTILALNDGISATNIINITGTGNVSVNDQAVTALYSVISGSGILNKTGTGTLTLYGNNLYTGGTILTSGHITLQNSNGFGSGTLSMSDGTTLGLTPGFSPNNTMAITGICTVNVGMTATATLTGVISGLGILSKTGSGTLGLSDANTYSGGTNLSEGQINLGNNAGLGTGTLTMAHATILALNDGISATNIINITGTGNVSVDDQYTTALYGVISGSGILNKTGTGTLTLYGNNLHSGGTTLSHGQITLGSNDALGAGSLNMDSSTVLGILDGVSTSNTINMFGLSGSIIVSSGAGTLAGTINGIGVDTTKLGEGNFILANGGTFSGNMDVLEGLFTANGVLTGDVSVQSGSTVKGTGTIENNLTVASGANLTPGNSIGTITLGSLDLLAGSITNTEIDPLSNSAIIVTGNANIAGTINVIQIPGIYESTGTYQILTAGSLSGAFDPIVTAGLPNFTFSLEYIGNTVNLNYGNLGIYTFGLSGNILTFSDYLNEYAPFSSEFAALTSLYGEDLVNAINSVSPARNVFGTYVTAQTMFSFSHLLNGYLCEKRLFSSNKTPKALANFDQDLLKASNDEIEQGDSKDKYKLWISGFADFARQNGESQNAAFDFNSQGFLVGFDYTFLNSWLLGGVVGYANSQISTDNNMGRSNINYAVASLYANYVWNNFYIEGTIWGGYNQIKNNRYISFANIQENALSTVNGGQLAPHTEVGGLFKNKYTSFEPYIGVDYVVNWEGSYTETGAGNLNMHVNAQTSSMIQTEVGFRLYQEVKNSYAYFGFKEGVSYINRTGFDTGDITTAIFGATQVVTLTSFTEAQNLGAVNVMFFVRPLKKIDSTISIGYQGQFGSQYTFNEIQLRFCKTF